MSKLQSVCTLCMLVCRIEWLRGPKRLPPHRPSLLRRAASSSLCRRMGRIMRPPPVSENPPLSGLDLPSLEPHAAPLSYLQPGCDVQRIGGNERGQRRRWFGSQLRRPSAGPPYPSAVVEQLRLGARLCRRYWVLQCERDRT